MYHIWIIPNPCYFFYILYSNLLKCNVSVNVQCIVCDLVDFPDGATTILIFLFFYKMKHLLHNVISKLWYSLLFTSLMYLNVYLCLFFYAFMCASMCVGIYVLGMCLVMSACFLMHSDWYVSYLRWWSLRHRKVWREIYFCMSEKCKYWLICSLVCSSLLPYLYQCCF